MNSTRTTAAKATKPGTQRRTSTKSLAQQYAERRIKGIVSQAIWTLRIALGGVYLIVIGAFVANYDHQRTFIKSHVDELTSFIVPAALDLLTITCIALLSLPVLEKVGKRVAIGGLIIAVGASSTLSALAPGDRLGKWVAGGLVALIAVGKIVTSFAQIDFAQLLSEETKITRAASVDQRSRTRRSLAERAETVAKAQRTRAANKVKADPLEEAYFMPSAPVSPAPNQ